MTKISDSDLLPKLIEQTWDAYNKAQGSEKDDLAEKYKQLNLELTILSDLTLDPQQQKYKDAVATIRLAIDTVKKAQDQQAKVATTISQVAAVIAALSKVAALAAG